MLENLIPVLESHSVSRCQIRLYIPQEFIKPEKMLERINKEEYFISKYQRRSTRSTKTFSIKNEKNNFSVVDENDKDNVIGFNLEQFNENGELENVLNLQNENKKSSITFETRKYNRWNVFFERFLSDLSNLIKDNDFYFEAISLTYIDEFIWISEDKIPVNDIFEPNSELINNKFLKSKNGTIILFSQNEDLDIEEKTEVSFNNELKRVQIIHQHATKFKDLLDKNTLIVGNRLKTILDLAHDSNKEMLKGLFSTDVKNKINLN